MTNQPNRADLRSSLLRARREMFVRAFRASLFRSGPVVVLVAAILIALDRRWGDGAWSVAILGLALLIAVALPLLSARGMLGSLFRSAKDVDDRAALKGRLSSAWQFLDEDELDEPRRLQIQNAIEHAGALNYGALFSRRRSILAYALPLSIVLAIASFFVPPYVPLVTVDASVDHRKEAQLDELALLQEELEEIVEDEELAEELKKLRDIEERFEEGDLTERDMMIEVARLEERIKSMMSDSGVSQLSDEVSLMIPPLMASEASRPTATALKQEEMKTAAEELEQLADRLEKGDLDDAELARLANAMNLAASKMGKREKNTFSGDLRDASKALKDMDETSFREMAKSMGDKMKSVEQYRQMKRMQNRLNMSKMQLGKKQSGNKQEECPVCNGEGCEVCEKEGMLQGLMQGQGQKPGGQQAGSAASGKPLGESNRLEDSYRKMLRVTGIAGEGPVESQVETTAGETSDSQRAVRDVYSEYAGVAEQAIEQEEIPLSHRFHVKRYFRAIRPVE